MTLGFLCLMGLLLVFVFQQLDLATLVFQTSGKSSRFLINRVFRFVLNDALTIGLIYAIFGERKYILFSLWIQLAGMVLFLVPYLVLKIYYPGYNGPLISFLHRLILNPTLLLLLIPAFYYQRTLKATGHS